MINIVCSLVLYLCCVLCVHMHAMDQRLQQQIKLQGKLVRAQSDKNRLHTRLNQQAHQIKQRSYVIRVLEFSTILLSWYVGEPYAAGVIAGGAAAVGAFTWQLMQAVENEDFTKEHIANTQRYMNVLQTLQNACDDQQLRQALQPGKNR